MSQENEVVEAENVIEVDDEMEERLEKLKEQAKELGIKRVHLFKDPEKLQEKIDSCLDSKKTDDDEGIEEEAVQEEEFDIRKPAPKMNVNVYRGNDRDNYIKSLNSKDPNCQYVYQSASISDEKLAMKGLERTPFSYKNDIICRTDKSNFEERLENKNNEDYKDMKTLESGDVEVGCFEAKAKKPR